MTADVLISAYTTIGHSKTKVYCASVYIYMYTTGMTSKPGTVVLALKEEGVSEELG